MELTPSQIKELARKERAEKKPHNNSEQVAIGRRHRWSFPNADVYFQMINDEGKDVEGVTACCDIQDIKAKDIKQQMKLEYHNEFGEYPKGLIKFRYHSISG